MVQFLSRYFYTVQFVSFRSILGTFTKIYESIRTEFSSIFHNISESYTFFFSVDVLVEIKN